MIRQPLSHLSHGITVGVACVATGAEYHRESPGGRRIGDAPLAGRIAAVLPRRWRQPLLLAIVTLAFAVGGCHPFPVHPDPFNLNGRDGSTSPPSYEALMRIAAAARAGGDLTNALSIYRRAAEINIRDPAPFVGIGDTLLAIGATNEAILAYDSALARDSHDLAAQIGLAQAYLETGRPELALTPLAQAAAQNPGNRRVLLLLGVSHDLAGQHAAAQADYAQGLKIAPNDPSLTVDLALSLATSGNFAAAINTLRPVATAPAATPAERQSLALIYGLQGDYLEAARIGRIDLDQAAVEHNLAYYHTLREMPSDAVTHAIFYAGISRPASSQPP